MKMAIGVVTMRREGWQHCRDTWTGHSERQQTVIVHDNRENNVGLVSGMQRIYEATQGFDVIFYAHDDCEIHEPGWDARVLAEFDDPKVGVVGFGGSLGHGSPDIYKVPYHISQLGRSQYMSNTDDAEVHGERFAGVRNVATLDGFALVVRRVLLDRACGWPVYRLTFHGYDHWLTLMAFRLQYRVRLVGVQCHHIGGQTSVGMGADDGSHAAAHRWIYDEFRDVLPVRV